MIILHLLPGLAAVAVFALAAPPLARAGLPPVWGMFLAVLLAVAPVELAIIRRYGPIRAVVDLALPRRRDLLRRLLPASLGAALAPGLVQWAEPGLHRAVSAALPQWWRLEPQVGAGRGAWVDMVTVAGWLLTLVLVGPVVEEVYFRGFLLPRIPAARPVAVVANAALFAMYHLWQPHTWLTVFVFAVVLAAVALRPRGVALAAIVHVTVNAMAFAALLSAVAQR